MTPKTSKIPAFLDDLHPKLTQLLIPPNYNKTHKLNAKQIYPPRNTKKIIEMKSTKWKMKSIKLPRVLSEETVDPKQAKFR